MHAIAIGLDDDSTTDDSSLSLVSHPHSLGIGYRVTDGRTGNEVISLRARSFGSILGYKGFMLVPTGPDGAAVGKGNPSLRLQEERRRVGLAIGRKRLLRSSTIGANSIYGSGGNDDRLLFRRGDDGNATAANNFLEISSPYKAVAFLRDDMVLASDDKGRLDAVRTPPKRGERGTLAASRLGEPVPGVQHSHGVPSLFTLNHGESFAMGLPGGEIRIFSTEHYWSSLGNSRGTLQQQPSPNHSYLRQTLRVGGPRRKYERADTSSHKNARSETGRSLCDMLKAPNSNDRYLQEICDWNEGRFPPSRYPNNTDNISLASGLAVTANSFAFHEDSAGRSLLAAHVDPAFDCFSLRVLDGRVSSETTDARGTICIDTKPLKERCPNKDIVEDISAITFVGDRILATSHVARVTKNQASNFIKLWDLRMIGEKDPKPCSSTSFIPSFPFDEARGVESWKETAFGGRGNVAVDPTGEEVPCTDFVISRLVGSVDGSRLSITTNTCSNETFDGHGMVDIHKCSALLVDSDQMNSVLHAAQLPKFRQPELNAFTPNLDFLASYQNGCDQAVLLFDLDSPTTKEAKDSNYSFLKKRTHDTMQGSNEYSSECNACLVGKLPAAFTDSFGIDSQLSCLSLDRHGTAIVGGSMDGDLFLWG